MGFRWDHGFITDKDTYVEKRLALQAELEQLTPIPDEDLEYAADVLDHFKERWETAEDDPDGQEYLLRRLLVRVWAEDGKVVRLCLRPDFHITAGLDATRLTEVTVDLEDDNYQSGDERDRSRSGSCWLKLYHHTWWQSCRHSVSRYNRFLRCTLVFLSHVTADQSTV